MDRRQHCNQALYLAFLPNFVLSQPNFPSRHFHSDGYGISFWCWRRSFDLSQLSTFLENMEFNGTRRVWLARNLRVRDQPDQCIGGPEYHCITYAHGIEPSDGNMEKSRP